MRLRPALLAFVLATRLAHAASGGTPITLVHSGYLLDGTDHAITNPAVSMTFRVSDGATSAGETVQWAGTCSGVAVAGGYYTVTLGGAGCVGSTAGGLDAVLDSADFPAGAARWLEVEVAGVTLEPRQLVGAAPTAAVAIDAQKLGGVAATTILDTGTGKLLASALPAAGITDAHVAGSAAIATSKISGSLTAVSGNGLGALATKSSIVDADVAAGAAIATSKLSGSLTAVSGNGLGALATKSTIVDADVAAGAAIGVGKLAPGSNTQVLTTTGGAATWAALPANVASFNTRTGAVSLTSADVTTALGFTPAAASGGAGYVQLSPGSAQTGGFHLTGNGTLGGDLFVQGMNVLDLFPFYRMTANQVLNSSGGNASIDGWTWNSGAGVSVSLQYTVQTNVPFSSRSADEQALLTAMGRAGTQYVKSPFRVYRLTWTAATNGTWTMYQAIPTLPSYTVAAFTKLESGSISGFWTTGITTSWSLTGIHGNSATHGYDHIHPTAGSAGSMLFAMPAAVAGWVDLRRPINWGWFPYVPVATVDQ